MTGPIHPAPCADHTNTGNHRPSPAADESIARPGPHNVGMQMTDGPAGTTPPGARLGAGSLTPLLAIVLVMIAALALREIASLVVPVLFGLFLALVAWPLVGRLEARGSRHAVALTATLLVVLAIVVVVA